MFTLINKIKLTRKQLILFLLLSIFVKLAITFTTKGFQGDLDFWRLWMEDLGAYQLGGIYTHDDSVNYPPMFLTVLWVFHTFVKHVTIYSVKLPVLIFDLLAVLLMMYVFRKLKLTDSQHRKLILYLLFSPVLLFISSVWGQIDFVHSALMCLAIIALPYLPFGSGLLFALALLTKLQAIVIAPVFALFLLQQLRQSNVRCVWSYISGFLLPWLLFSVYFILNFSFVAFIQHSYMSAVGYFPYVSLYAMNIWFHVFGVAPETLDTQYMLPHLTYRAFGFGLLALFTAYSIYYLTSFKQYSLNTLLKSGLILSFSFYMLPTEIHDRYIIPSVVLLVMVAFFERKRVWFVLMLGLDLASLVGIAIFLKHTKYPWLDQLGTKVPYVFIAMFVTVIIITWNELHAEKRKLMPSDDAVIIAHN
ncbi:hypothetical protein [Paenibacillus cremeus]|uniref:DUF2029 domain-containing protein n=1 Tax=Paenibacillus cremeus TaxID=2163881 RepID=A0A559KFP0_9BACL|nr:hypothetical protein [Paenibacillus cremeus]TVY10918.1 hypothetical protein FPZ49_05420 [Paenibacillus cremeus]